MNQWTGGTTLMEMNQNMCDESGKSKQRKGDLYTKLLIQLIEKFGNIAYMCPLQKVSYPWHT